MELTEKLQELRQSTPDVDLMLQVFEEADRVHTAARIAMGQQAASSSSPVASTSVVISFSPDVSAVDNSPMTR